MADEIDRAQEREQFDRDLALRAVVGNHGQGRAECACGEGISQLRQGLGAVRCLDCQTDHERRR